MPLPAHVEGDPLVEGPGLPAGCGTDAAEPGQVGRGAVIGRSPETERAIFLSRANAALHWPDLTVFQKFLSFNV